MATLAERVAAHLPGSVRVKGTTLAAPGAFEAAVAELGDPLIYPFFMADGWFVRKALADRVAPFGLTVARPFGMDPELERTAAAEIAAVLAQKSWDAAETTLLVAAHGSAVSQRNHDRTRDFAASTCALAGMRRVICGFVEQEPALEQAATGLDKAICLPFFALRAGHYLDDIPHALASAGFAGPVMPPLIEWVGTARLIAASVVPNHDDPPVA